MAPNPYLKAIAGQATSTGAPGSPATPKDRKHKKGAGDKKSQTPGSANKGKGKANDGAGLTKSEVLALGGDEEDFKMLQDLESESELEGDDDDEVEADASASKQGKGKTQSKKELAAEIRSFMQGLDFKTDAPVAESDEEGLEGDESSDDAEEAEEEVQEEPANPVEKEKAVPATSLVTKKEKKESKVEREQRRKVEREAEKERERAAKAEERVAKEEKLVSSIKTPASKSPWIVEPIPQWYNTPLPTPLASATRPSASVVSGLLARGQELLARDNDLYSSSLDPNASKGSAPPPPTGLSKADQVFVQQILTSGTSSDKVSALLLLVSSSPVHTMSYLEQLAALSRKKSRDESGRALRGVVDWWRGEGGGSPNRKLRAFADQPLLATVAAAFEAYERGAKGAASAPMAKDAMEKCLALFAFEDWFKKWFFRILQALEQMSVDPLAHPRTVAVLHLANLLRDKPEQESNILRLLVNKLGDTQRGIASKTSHHLLQVLQSHPGMTPILVREVASLVLRPRSSSAPGSSSGSHVRFGDDDKKKGPAKAAPDHARDNARYYGIITLNQVMLNKDQGDVAGKMIDVYFEVFGDVLGRLPDKAEDESDEDEDKEEKRKVKDKGQKRKRGDKKTEGDATQTTPVNDMDSKLVAAVLTGINRAFPFAKLDDDAFKRRLDTLFRITHTGTFNVSIQALLLIYHVSAAKRAISDRFYRALYASILDSRLTTSSKQALYLNLVFRATKHDPDPKRVMAFVKRLVQVLSTMDVTFTLGALFVVGELMSTVPGLREMLAEPESYKLEATRLAKEEEKKNKKDKKQSQEDGEDKQQDKEWPTAYDGKKREPEFANANNSCLWELVPLLNHWHPTVSLYASSILTFTPLPIAEDLEQHSLNTFLDRFVYREPKKSVSSKGSSMMQSGLQGQDRSGRVVRVKGSAAKKGEEAVNSDKFRRKNVHDVPADQLFFHKYFTSRSTVSSEKSKATSKRKSRRGGRDDELDSDSEAESIDDAGVGMADEGFDEEALEKAMEEDLEQDEQGKGQAGEKKKKKSKEVEEEEEVDSDDSEMEAEIWKAMRKSMPKEKGDDDMLDGASDLDEDDDPDGSDDEDLAAYDYSDSDDDDQDSNLAIDEDMGEFVQMPSGGEENEDEDEDEDEVPYKSPFADEGAMSEDDDGFLEADDDLLDSDEDVPLYGGDSSNDEEEVDRQKKKQKKDDKKDKKKKLKQLPLFATADDYAKLIGGSDDEDI
ncbi:hypothetical protein JCM10212_003360 [Sporobolomyces blumeae]